MRLELTGRNVEISPALRALVDRKLVKLTRVLNDAIVSAQVVLTQEKYRHVTDMSLHMSGDHVKWVQRKRRATPARALPAPAAETAPEDGVRPRIVRASRYHVKPLAVDDAATAVEAGRDGFLVFRNADTGAINVLYRRKNGDLGLIEPER